MNEDEIEVYVQLWTSVKSYIPAKEKESACEHFLSVINENVCDLEEVAALWAGYDGTIDKVIRNNYIEYNDLDDDYDENDFD